MTKRRVTIALVIAGLLIAAVLAVLADPPAWKDCFYSGQECVWPIQQCEILGIPGFAKTCIEEWYCPEYYWESCGTCICVIF